MLVTITLIIIIITAVISLACYGVCTVYGRESQDEALVMQRRFLRFLSLALTVHLFFTIFRLTHGAVEIIDTMSMLSLFFVIEAIFLAALALNTSVAENRKTYRVIFNQVIIFLFAIHLYTSYVMGFDDIYYTFADFFHALQHRHISFFIRAMTVLYLAFYCALMIGIIRRAVREQRAEMEAEGKRHLRQTRMGRLLYGWTTLITLMTIGQFIGWPPLALCISVTICGQLIFSVVGYLRLCRTETQTNSGDKGSAMYHKLIDWLDTTPFPLRESLTMDDIAEAVGIDRDAFSAYIYEVRGLTFTSWVRDHRLEYCQRRLQSTTLTLSQIAYESGYGDLPAMSKAFKKKYGITPSAYRKQR